MAICDANRERAEKLAATFPAKVYTDLDAMLKGPTVDVVNLLTPNHLDRTAVLACARAGKHVITEKPPAMSLAETDEMIEVRRKAGVLFACSVQCRVRKAVQAVKRAREEGASGASCRPTR